jgi:hypothetical protein
MPGAVFPAERGLRARGPKPARQDFRRPNRASQVCKDSPLEGDGFELPVRGSGEAGLSPLFLAPIAWAGSACCGSALFFIDIDRLTLSL